MAWDVSAIRRQFAFLRNAEALTYLDNAATTQKPDDVLDAMRTFYETENGNAYRGMHPLAEVATIRWEQARKTVAKFVKAKRAEEVIFTKSATESLNLVARSLGETWKKGDIVVISMLEHHSNIVPWQQLKQSVGIEVRWLPCDHEGALDLSVLDDALSTGRVKLVSVTGQSNVLGVRPPIKKITEASHRCGAAVLVDAAQWIAHGAIDVQALDCDFLVFSGHKLYGPIGIGVLYGKKRLLEQMPPFLGGGGMIAEVTTEGFSVADVPEKFEAGTLPIADAVGLASAIDWLNTFDRDEIHAHEHDVLMYACERLREVKGVTLLGPKDDAQRFGCVSFTVDGVHPHDLTEVLGREGFCLRAGHLCAAPLHTKLKIPASTRLSVGIYNTKEEVDTCVDAIQNASARLRR